MKQTVVEWLAEQLNKQGFAQVVTDEEIKKAKELEKEQIEDAFCDGVDDEYEHHINGSTRKNSEQYYDETYKNEGGN